MYVVYPVSREIYIRKNLFSVMENVGVHNNVKAAMTKMSSDTSMFQARNFIAPV